MSEPQPLCWRCNQPITGDNRADNLDVFGASGAGAIVELHQVCPVRPPRSDSAPARSPYN